MTTTFEITFERDENERKEKEKCAAKKKKIFTLFFFSSFSFASCFLCVIVAIEPLSVVLICCWCAAGATANHRYTGVVAGAATANHRYWCCCHLFTAFTGEWYLLGKYCALVTDPLVYNFLLFNAAIAPEMLFLSLSFFLIFFCVCVPKNK